MLKRYAFTFVALITLILISFIATAQSERKEPLVPVQLSSRPDVAEIRVDGAFVGTSPLQYRLTPGVHKIEYSRRAFQTWQRDLWVSADSPTKVTALLDESAVKPCPAVQ